MPLPSRSDFPWPPPERPELRNTRFRQLDKDLVERWVWEANGDHWDYRNSFVPSQVPLPHDFKPTPEELEHARNLAVERGWI